MDDFHILKHQVYAYIGTGWTPKGAFIAPKYLVKLEKATTIKQLLELIEELHLNKIFQKE